MTPAGVPNASKRGTKSEVAHKWDRWLHNPCCLGGPQRFRAGRTKSEVAHKWAGWLHTPCRLGGPQRFRAGDRITNGPKMGLAAT